MKKMTMFPIPAMLLILIANYFYPEKMSPIILYGVMTFYMGLVLLSMTIVAVLFIIEKIKDHEAFNDQREVREQFNKVIKAMYRSLKRRSRVRVYFVFVLSVAIAYFAAIQGFWFLMILEILSETINIHLTEKAHGMILED